jgi:hypothetical protein
MDFAIPEDVERLCDGICRFMEDHVYPLERHHHWKMQVGSPAYSPAIPPDGDPRRASRGSRFWVACPGFR